MVQPASTGHRERSKDVKTVTLLPSDHSAARIIEALFRRFAVIESEALFLEAGFNILSKRGRSLMRVATHPMVTGYVFKVFFVDELPCVREKSRGWGGFIRRCDQAERIRRLIEEHAFQYFKVPRKWLFHAPHHPACRPDDQPMILVAEFQDLLPRADNEHAWSHSITEDHLDELYAVISRAGGASYRPDNIALTTDGRFAFIDTEHSSGQHDYESIVPYLSGEMRRYWSNLIK